MGFPPRIRELLLSAPGYSSAVRGWVKSARKQKRVAFLRLTDGSEGAGLQVVVDRDRVGEEKWKEIVDRVSLGSSVEVQGEFSLPPSGAKQQVVELQANQFEVLGECPNDTYPLQKKNQTFEFLRTIPHLRGRTNTFGAMLRIRNSAAMAFHNFFQSIGLSWIHAPILTSLDCEGAGELFEVRRRAESNPDNPFFGQTKAYLTVSAQLHAEIFASYTSGVYSFGPTFRAEESRTKRHLAEFYMIEPEISFADLNTVLETARDSLVHVSKELLTKNSDDFHFFESARSRNLSATTTDAVDAHSSDFDSNALGILERLEGLASKEKYAIMTYSEAIDVLERSPKVFSHPVHWGAPLQTEHEKFLAEEHVGTQVFIIHYPKKIKPFYMKQSGFQRDRETVAAMDLLVPGVGEIIGGSQRIDKVEELEEAINIHGLNAKDYQWYLDIRRFGSVPHGGFGLGFDRFIQYVTGVNNIRDVVLIPRALGTLPF